MIHFSSDAHFGDTRVISLMDRPFDSIEAHERALISRWNGVVAPDDTVYLLGDFALTEETVHLAGKLNGHKHLIKGNYDKFADELYLRYFESVQDDLLLQTEHGIFYLNHYPTKGRSDFMNLSGHIHAAYRVQRNMINVGVDVWHYLPVSLDKILKYYNAISGGRYDANVFAGELLCNKSTCPLFPSTVPTA